jgi:protein-S-isoprenylcysteine O-methyltransferase Ste14
MSEQPTAGVIAPPPLIYLAGLLVGLALDRLWPLGLIVGVGWLVVGAALAAAGIGVMLAGSTRFRAAGTPVQPWKPASALVVSGIFRHTRNPMYLGMTLLYLGLALLFGDVVTLALLLPVLGAIRWGVIAREERYLAARFGQPYFDYKARVRRWL